MKLDRDQRLQLAGYLCLAEVLVFPSVVEHLWVAAYGPRVWPLTLAILLQAITRQVILPPEAIHLIIGTACLLFTGSLAAASLPLGLAWWVTLAGPLPSFAHAIPFTQPVTAVTTPMGDTGFLFAIHAFGDSLWRIIAAWLTPLIMTLALLAISRFRPVRPNLYQACFAKPRDVRPLFTYREDLGHALVLGLWHGWWRTFFLGIRPTWRLPEPGHVLLVGPSRSGKGLHAVTQLLLWTGSCIANDIKGELHTLTAGHRARALGSRLYVLNPTGPSHRYDPLRDLLTIPGGLAQAATLILQPAQDRDAIFAQRAMSGFMAGALAARHLKTDPWPYLREALRHGLRGFVRFVGMVSEPEVAFHLAQFLGAIPPLTEEQLGDRFLNSAWSTLTTRLQPFLEPNVLNMLTGNDFRATDLVEQKTTLYLQFRESVLESLSPVYRLILLAILSALIHQYDITAGSVVPLLLLLDEAGRTPIPRLPEVMATVAGRGMSVLLYVQSLSQLHAAYGEAGSTTIRDNARSQIFYRPTDQATAEFISRRCGQTLVPTTSTHVAAGGWRSPRQTVTQGEVSRPLIPPDKVTQMDMTDVIVFVAGLPPISCRRVDWRDADSLVHATQVPAPTLPRHALRPAGSQISGPAPEPPVKKAAHGAGYLDPDDPGGLSR